ncbi:MAG: hypothetical protein NC395_03830 [Prevotella sp.]|nr:hypothetical protein [Prevotella sp.]
MTIAQRKRAAKLQKVMYSYSRWGRAWLVMLLAAVLQIVIITVASVSGIMSDQTCIVAPASSMFTFVQFFVCMLPVGVDSDINEKVTQEAYHGSVMPAKFMSCLPFEARDLLNLKLCLWEKAAAVNVLFVAAGHIISLIAEAYGYEVYRGAAGLFTLMAIISEAIFMVPYLVKSVKFNVVLGVFIGFGFSFACGVMDGLSADAFAPLKIFSGVSGILVYTVATVLIAVIGELYAKNRKDASWGLFGQKGIRS